MAVTMTQIAREVGVSVGVVSRLLRDDPTLNISDQRRKQILQAVDRLGGVELRPRRRLQSRVILVPMEDIHSPAWLKRNIMTGERWGMFRKTVEAAGLMLHMTFYSRPNASELFKRLITQGKQCDGLLLLDHVLSEEVAQLIWAEAFPHVCFSELGEMQGLNVVRANLQQGIRRGMMYLADQGHRRIAFVGKRVASTYPMFVSSLAACGLPIDQSQDCVLPGLPPKSDQVRMYDQAYEHATRWLKEVWPHTRITAVMGEDDRVASAVLQAMVDQGLTPGVDLSVLGCGNQAARDIHPQGRPPCGITTVDHPFGRIGLRAGELLINQIMHGQTHIVHEHIPTRLIIRESTGRVRHGES